LTLATEDIPFRGHRENNETESKGKFLAIIELLGKYDPVLTELLQRPEGTTKYLSPAIQNEIITALGDKVKYDILLEIRKAPFFSYIFDSTQDISKICNETQRSVHFNGALWLSPLPTMNSDRRRAKANIYLS